VADVEQAGAIKAVTVAEFLAAAEGTSLYELTGVVKNIKNTTYGNFDIVDATGSVYVYGLTNNGAVGANDKTFASLGINEGDKVTIVGTRASYNGTAQVGGTAYLVAHTAAQAATIAEFLAAPVSADKWYKLTGTIESIVKEEYGNFYLTDGTSRVYVYGVTAAPVAKNDKSFPSLGVKAGDKITIVGTRAQYASSSVEDQKEQVGGPAYYVSHEAATEPEPEQPEALDPFVTNVTCTTVSSAYTDGVATVNGTANVFTLKLGTSKLNGKATVKLPAGTKKVSFYAVGWKGTSATLKFSVAGTQVASQAIKANEGATGNAPYTMTVADTDRYSISFDAALAADTDVTVETTGSAYRAIIFGIQAQ
jgi:phage gpG-like protein